MRKMQLFKQLSPAIFIIGLMLSPVFSEAQQAGTAPDEPWSLEECIEYAKENNISIQRQRLYIEQAETNLKESKYSFAPTLSASANHVINWGQTVDRYTNQFASSSTQSNNFSLSSQFDLFNGFTKLNTLKQRQLQLQINQYEVDKMIDDVSLNITTYFLQVLFYREMVKTTETQLQTTQLQVERTEKLVEAGTLARGDLYNIQAQAAAEELNVVESQNQLEISLLTLAQILDLNNEAYFDIESPELDIEAEVNPTTAQGVYEYAVKHQPEIKAAELGVDEAEAQIKLARGQYYPSLNLYASWATGYSGAAKEGFNPQLSLMPIGIVQNTMDTVMGFNYNYDYRTKSFSDQISDNDNKSIGFYLTVPIFNGLSARSSVSRAKIARADAELALEQSKNDLNKIIQQAEADARAAYKKYYSAEKKVVASQESFNYAEQKLNVGMINTVEYNEMKKELTKAEAELLQAKYDFIFKTKILDYYLGIPLTLEEN